MIERYRRWYEQEKAATIKLFEMLESVPQERRSEKFDKALGLTSHLFACRLNWLDRMVGQGTDQMDWWPGPMPIDQLRELCSKAESKWTDYLASITDSDLDVDFEFPVGTDKRFRWNIEGQIMQMVGHAFYHRGQIAMIVDDLGGKPQDTDYLYWAFAQEPERWKAL